MHAGETPHREFQRTRDPMPILALSILTILIALWCVFSTNLTGASAENYPLLLAAVMLAVISLFDIRVGLAVLLLAIGLSPEFTLFGIDNFRYEDIVFPVIFLIWISKVVLHKQRLRSIDLKTPLLLIIFLTLVSSIGNHIYYGLDLRSAALRFGKSVEYYFMMVVVLNVLRGERDLRAFVCLIVASSAFVGLYGLVQFMLTGQGSAWRMPGPPGETPNILGGYFVFHMCLALGIVSRTRSLTRFLFLSYLALMAYPFIMTLSRTSYLALTVGLVVIWVVGRNHSIGLAVAIITAGALLAPNYVLERAGSILDIFTGAGDSSWDSRVAAWRTLFIPQALQSPLIGQGVGSRQLGEVDSEYVLQLNDLGLIGLLAFLVLLFRCVRTSWRLHDIDRTGTGVLPGFATGYLGGSIALMVHSLAATTFTTIRTTEPFFFATGLLYAYWHLLAPRHSLSMQTGTADPPNLLLHRNPGVPPPGGQTAH